MARTKIAAKVDRVAFSLLFLAYLPPGKYAAYPGPWGFCLNTLRERYARKYPGLFKDLRFERPIKVPGFSAYCREGLLMFESISKLMKKPGGPVSIQEDGKLWVSFPPDFQERLRKGSRLLAVPSEIAAIIQELAEVAARDKLIELREANI